MRQRATRRGSSCRTRLCLERLEDRLAPAVDYWTGAAGTHWNDIGNWQTTPGTGGTHVLPVTGDDLVFQAASAGAIHLTNVNDFPAGTSFNSIQFSDAYSVSGNDIVSGSMFVASPGAVTVQGGTTLSVGSGGLTLVGATITLGAGTRLQLGGGVTTVASSSTAQILDGGGSGTAPVVDLQGTSAVFRVGAGSAPQNEDLLVSPAIVNGQLTKMGQGQMALTGHNTYTGGTDVNSGTLLVNAPGSLPDTGTVTVDIHGTLSGTGAVGNIDSEGGTVSPGIFGTGILSGHNVALNTFNAAGQTVYTTYAVDINGTTAGSQYDQLNVTGNVTLNNAMLEVALGYIPAIGDSYTLINTSGGTISGTFMGLPEGSNVTISGLNFTISYRGNGGTSVLLTRGNGETIRFSASANPVIAGSPFAMTVTIQDASGQPVTSYNGTVHLVLTGPVQAMRDFTFTGTDMGQHTFSNLVLRRAGVYTLTGADTVNPLIAGSTTVTVTPAPADHIAFTLNPPTITHGMPFSITVTVQDAYNNTVTGYTGTVHFVLMGPVHPTANYTFTAADMGSRTFNIPGLNQTGMYTLTGTDMADPSLTGSIAFTVM
jgi:autotransporter-associated beta strand protein